MSANDIPENHEPAPLLGLGSSEGLGPRCRSELGGDAACGWMGRCMVAEPMQTGAERDCEHGQLARSCDRCVNAREIARLSARVRGLETQRAADEARWVEWLVDQGLLHYHDRCHRPDGSNGPARVLAGLTCW